MELKIENYEVAPSIDFNFEQLKTEVATKMADYSGLVYNDTQVGEAKKDIAGLRKFVTALDDARKDVKNRLLEPYKEFELKINEVKALVEEPIELIDSQLKTFEENRKTDKQKEIEAVYEKIEFKKPEFDFLSAVFNQKWLNATYSISTIENELREAILKYNDGLTTISKLAEFQYETLMEYQRTLDLGKALEKNMLLKEEAQKKAEYEAKKSEPKADFMNKPEVVEETAEWIGFEALLTPSDAHKLAEFLKANKIKYRKPQNK